jgi:hypothetical protein
MVVDWYNKWLDTEYEGINLPWLYHKYVGHDNNRDLVLMNMVETRMMAKVLFEEWFPVAFIDYHHYGSYWGRYYIPPFVNPTDPNVDPLIWTEQQLFGGAMINRLEQEGCIGVENYAVFTAEFNSTYTRVCGCTASAGCSQSPPAQSSPHPSTSTTISSSPPAGAGPSTGATSTSHTPGREAGGASGTFA